MKSYKGVFRFSSNKKYYDIHVDKNNSVYDIVKLEVKSWKQGKNKKKVPDVIEGTRDRKLFDMLYGQPRPIVERKLELICSFNEE